MIIEARCSGILFSDCAIEYKKYYANEIMGRGAAISGGSLPNTEFILELIIDEILVLIDNFGYSGYSTNEIILALRLNMKSNIQLPDLSDIDTVVFTGNSFNTDYLSKILLRYSKIRNYLDRQLQNEIDGY